jgi:hypothetical protein
MVLYYVPLDKAIEIMHGMSYVPINNGVMRIIHTIIIATLNKSVYNSASH